MLHDVRRLTPILGRRAPELLLSGASVAAGLVMVLCLELGARWALRGEADGAGASGGIYDGHVYSERLGWEPRPGARFLIDGAQTSINSFGYRGAQLPREPQPGHIRVVLLGDSVAFGYGVADDQTFGHLLDPQRRRFEAVNLAVPGYGVDQSLLRYELSGTQWHPHVVLLNLCVDNDLADIMLPVFLYDGQHPKPRFSLSAGMLELHDEQLRLSRPARLGLWLSEHSLLYRRLARQQPSGPSTEEHWSERRRRALEDRGAAEDLMAALVGRLRGDVERDAGRLVLAVHPSQASYRGDARWVDRLTMRPELDGLQVVSLEEAYRRNGAGFGRVTLDEIGHLNPRGHQLAADFLRAALEHWPLAPVAE